MIVHLGKHYYPDYGGIETATQDLAEAGARLGHKTLCHTSAPKRARAQHYALNGVQIKRHFTFGKLLSTPLAPTLLLASIPAEAIVHVHLPNPLAELRALWISGRRKTRIVPYFHAMAFRGRGIGGLWYRMITRRLLKRSEAVLVSNPAMTEIFPALREFGDKVRVVPFVTEAETQEEARSLWRERREEKIVLMVGRMVPYKGHRDLLKAWSESHAATAGSTLVMIGEGPLYPEILAYARALPHCGNVRFLPSCDEGEKLAWLRRARLFVLPSRDESETFGIAALEAMARALPVLTTDVPTGLRFLARGGACGGLAQARNPESLGTELRRMLGMPLEELEKIGMGNLTFARERHSPLRLDEDYSGLLGRFGHA